MKKIISIPKTNRFTFKNTLPSMIKKLSSSILMIYSILALKITSSAVSFIHYFNSNESIQITSTPQSEELLPYNCPTLAQKIKVKHVKTVEMGWTKYEPNSLQNGLYTTHMTDCSGVVIIGSKGEILLAHLPGSNPEASCITEMKDTIKSHTIEISELVFVPGSTWVEHSVFLEPTIKTIESLFECKARYTQRALSILVSSQDSVKPYVVTSMDHAKQPKRSKKNTYIEPCYFSPELSNQGFRLH